MNRTREVRRLTSFAGLVACVVVLCGVSAAPSSGLSPSSTYDQVVLSDGFESGLNWTVVGNGTASISSAAADTGSSGLRVANDPGEYTILQRSLSSAVPDSSVSFALRVNSAAGVQMVAEMRDHSNSAQMWGLLYDGNAHAFWFYPRNGSGQATEIFTGSNSAPVNAWIQVEVQYTAAANGGARIYLNGATQSGWGVSADYTRATNLQNVQLWNDGPNTIDFDHVVVSVPQGSVPSEPGPPTAVTGTPGDSQVTLSWTAPANNGGSPITGYRITPFIGNTAQSPTTTSSAATNATVAGLTNGTAYTFAVAAINSVGTGPDSARSAAVTPAANAATTPGPPTSVAGTPGDGEVSLTWNAPASDGGSAITTYVVTPYIGSNAQQAISTGSAATAYTVMGLENGTAYRFTVTATNSAGPGPASAPSAPITPTVGPYSSLLFADGFESGSFAGWSPGSLGNGSATLVSAAAHSGAYGLRLANSANQFGLVAKSLSSPLADSKTTFWLKVGSAAGTQQVAQARDFGSGVSMWALFYDGAHQGFYFYPTRGSVSTEIYTGNNTVPLNTWVKVDVYYAATNPGGAQLYVNGQTQPSWSVSGDYTRAENLQRLQLWNDAANTVYFDDVRVSQPPAQGPGLPGVPAGVSAVPGDGQVRLSWAVPVSNGGSPITGYRITARVNGFPQAPVFSPSPTPSYTLTGLTNGSSYTFTVAAANPVGTGDDSAPSAAVTPSLEAATVPGAPTNVVGTAGDGLATLMWSAPSDDGGSAIIGYRITPYVGSTAQTPILTPTPATRFTVHDLANGTTYRFAVAAVSHRGTGADSTQSAGVIPSVGRYSSVVFSDGFESGNLTSWPGANLGTGTAAATTTAAHNGSFGLRLTNASNQYSILLKAFASPLVDSQTSFWLRIGSDAGVQQVAQARDSSNSRIMWTLYYDGARHGFWFYPANGAGASTALFTGNDSASPGSWHKLAIQYTAIAVGGAQLYVDGETQPDWGVAGDYSRTEYLQKLQIWNDAANSVDFDDIKVAIPSSQPAGQPGAPTNVVAQPDDQKVSLTWTAPTVDGGGIIGYRVTPYRAGVAQTPIETGSPSTTYLVSGLTNGTAYTFTVAAESSVGTGPDSTASAPVTPAVLNAVQRENNLQGDPQWGNFGYPSSPQELAAYSSRVSVNHGQSVDFYATTTAPSLTLDIYRMGWYGGAGARHVQSMGSFPGVNQPQAQPNPVTGMISENWTRTATLDVPSSWTSGVYVARFMTPSNVGTFAFFVVRNDGGHEAVDFQTSVNTYQAYNEYGGTSAYVNNTNHQIYTGAHATKVSFDRPFANGNGVGDFLRFDYPFVRWLEKEGYDVTYTTDLDTSTNANLLTNHKMLLVVGHDEYWSKGQRDNVEAAIAAGVNVGFFSGNEAYWQVRYEPNAAGTPNRVMVTYKDYATDTTVPWGPDPKLGVDNSVLTTHWRDPHVNRPEDSMIGIMFGGETNNTSPDSPIPGQTNYDMVITNASHWIYQGTGWSNGHIVPGIVGYEYDRYFENGHSPPGTTMLSATSLINSENGEADTANSSIYTAPSGAMVFAAGTIQWSWGLDSFGGGAAYVNPGLQRVTANIVARFTQ